MTPLSPPPQSAADADLVDPRYVAGFVRECFPEIDGLDLSTGGLPACLPRAARNFLFQCYRLNAAIRALRDLPKDIEASIRRARMAEAETELRRLGEFATAAENSAVHIDRTWEAGQIRKISSLHAATKNLRATTHYKSRTRGFASAFLETAHPADSLSISTKLSEFIERNPIGGVQRKKNKLRMTTDSK